MGRTGTHVIVVGNEKGGSGKSTTAFHLAIYLLYQGFRVASIDVDSRQQTFTNYVKNRRSWAQARDWNANSIEDLMRFTMPFDASGSPTVTLPCGYTQDGRPIAFQLVGAHGSEALLLKVAHAYQQVTDFHLRRPDSFA